MTRHLQSPWIDSLGLAFLHASRLLEALLPPQLLRWALLPFAAAIALYSLLVEPRSQAAARARACPHPGTRFKSQVRLQLSRFVSTWPDRLSEPRWQRRFEIRGAALQQALATGRPVILVSGHFGPFHLVSYFLRANGIPAATFIDNPARAMRASRRAKIRLSRLPGIKTTFSSQDPPREIHRFLKQDNVVRMAFDVPVGTTIEVPCGAAQLSFATGSIRLAAATGASLIPYAISESSPWHFVLHLGSPVPPELLARKADPAPAAQHIAAECWGFFSQSPAQAQAILLAAMSSRARDPLNPHP